MRKIFRFTLIILFITSKANSQTNYEVYALKFSSVGGSFPLSGFVLNAPAADSMHAVFMVWLIRGNNGKNILVDAGFLQDIEDAKDYRVTNYTRADSMLLRIGLQAKDITDVILSHPHWDHMDGIDLFPNEHVWIQKEDYNYCVGAAWQKDGRPDFNKRDIRKIVELNMAGKVTLTDGDNQEILPGINVYTGSRHTFNSQYVLVKSGKDKIILASDNVYTYYNPGHLVSAPSDETFDTTAYVKAMVRMKTLVSDTKLIIPGHDALLFSKFPIVAEGVIKIK